MEELKILVEMVAELPDMALWVIGFFFAYKLFILGSMYGVARLAIVKLHDWLTRERVVKTRIALGRHLISSVSVERVDAIIESIKISTGTYIHNSDLDRLEKAIAIMKEQNL